MLISTLVPGGGQVWTQGIASALTIWISFLIFGGAALAITAAHAENVATLREQGWLMTDAERREAEDNVSSQATMMFWAWVLVGVIWLANIFDARREAMKHNRRLAAPIGTDPSSAPPFALSASAAPPTFIPDQRVEDSGARLMRLSALRNAGALTEDEFQAKKKELLDRL